MELRVLSTPSVRVASAVWLSICGQTRTLTVVERSGTGVAASVCLRSGSEPAGGSVAVRTTVPLSSVSQCGSEASWDSSDGKL